MLKEVQGDLLEADCEMLVHGCNCHGVMGSGVALAVRTKYPKAFEDYHEFYEYVTDKPYIGPLLGKVNFSEQPDGKVIANAFTQQNFGRDPTVRYMSYEAVDSCMKRILMYAEIKKIDSIAMSRIGAGLGNAPWSVTRAIIWENFKNFNGKVLIYYT